MLYEFNIAGPMTGDVYTRERTMPRHDRAYSPAMGQFRAGCDVRHAAHAARTLVNEAQP